jgi:isocitrate dehydrogenase
LAQGYASLGMKTSESLAPDGKPVETEAAHGTVTCHYRQHQQGKETLSTRSLQFSPWTSGLRYRGMFDNTPDFVHLLRTSNGFASTPPGAGSDPRFGDPDPRRSPVADDNQFFDKLDSNLTKAMT